MVDAILLQITPPVGETLRVCTANHCDCVMYAEHVLLHCLILLLLDLIQGPYHGIVIALVTECLLHVHQQVLHGDILAFIQHAGPFAGVPMETVRDVGDMLASSYCSQKASISNCQSVYVTSTLGLVDLKIGISNLAGTSCFFSLLTLQPLCLCQQPAVSLTVEYPSESGAPLSREEGGEPPLPTAVDWDLVGLLYGCIAPVWEVSLASATSSTLEALPACCGTLPTSWPEKSDSPAFMTGILWTGFSAQPLSLWQSEAATTHCHASIKGKRLMVEVGRMQDPLLKSLLHLSLDSMRGILPQTPMALLIIKEQISSARAIHLHVFQLPKNRVALQYVHDHPHIPGEHGGTGPTRMVCHRHLQHHGVFFCWGLIHPFPNICQHIRQPLHRKS